MSTRLASKPSIGTEYSLALLEPLFSHRPICRRAFRITGFQTVARCAYTDAVVVFGDYCAWLFGTSRPSAGAE